MGVQAGTPVALSAAATDTRFNQSNGTEATQAIAGAEFTIDVPPWQAGATAVPLGAADGAFNASTEALAARSTPPASRRAATSSTPVPATPRAPGAR